MPKRFEIFLVAIVLVVAAFSLSACNKREYPKPSKEFFVNDFADALLPGSRNTFFYEGERLYEDTKDTELGGAQVVLVTMLAESEEKAAEIDRTALFREWKIGENDMGLLILLIFTEEGEDKLLIRAEIEIGYRMEQYVTAARAGYVLDNCLYNPEWGGSLDMGLGEMYYELLSTIYVDAYGYDSFNYDMEEYRQYLIDADDEIGPQVPMSLLLFVFSPYGSVWYKILAIALFVLFGGGGLFGILFSRHRGGGGSSGGYGVRR